jgi:hypothetical protein
MPRGWYVYISTMFDTMTEAQIQAALNSGHGRAYEFLVAQDKRTLRVWAFIARGLGRAAAERGTGSAAAYDEEATRLAAGF